MVCFIEKNAKEVGVGKINFWEFLFSLQKKRAGLIMKSKKEPIMFNDGSDLCRDKNSL